MYGYAHIFRIVQNQYPRLWFVSQHVQSCKAATYTKFLEDTIDVEQQVSHRFLQFCVAGWIPMEQLWQRLPRRWSVKLASLIKQSKTFKNHGWSPQKLLKPSRPTTWNSHDVYMFTFHHSHLATWRYSPSSVDLRNSSWVATSHCIMDVNGTFPKMSSGIPKPQIKRFMWQHASQEWVENILNQPRTA